MAAYIVFETGHTAGPSMLYPVYISVVRPAYNSTPANTTPKYIGSRVFPSEALRMARTLKGMLGVRLRTSHEARAALTGIYWRISAHKASRRKLSLLYSTSYSRATREDTR